MVDFVLFTKPIVFMNTFKGISTERYISVSGQNQGAFCSRNENDPFTNKSAHHISPGEGNQ